MEMFLVIVLMEVSEVNVTRISVVAVEEAQVDCLTSRHRITTLITFHLSCCINLDRSSFTTETRQLFNQLQSTTFSLNSSALHCGFPFSLSMSLSIPLPRPQLIFNQTN